VEIVPNLFRFVMDLFKRAVETIDRLLYSVDEWLRFRTGEGYLALTVKASLGLVWRFVTYVVRVYVNLFIEPQVNPIKHFPAVTVGAKLLLPFTFILVDVLSFLFSPFGPVVASTIAWTHVWLLPGVFGFLVWELQANWRVYQANRARNLGPIVIGSHGETMARLLKPGFHSGTLPKLFTRWRRAERRAWKSGNWELRRKPRNDLHHLEEDIKHFIDREFLALLEGSRRWSWGEVHLGAIRLGTNVIRLEFLCPNAGPQGMWLAIEHQEGWLIAGVTQWGWLERIDADSAEVLSVALAGLHRLAGVHLTRDQISSCLGKPTPPYDVTNRGLIAWDDDFKSEYVCDVQSLRFHQEPLSWSQWVAMWERDQQGKPLREAPDEIAMLPVNHEPAGMESE
jgi:hypothetical protein